MRNKNEDTTKKVSKLQKSQDENVGWWQKLSEDQKIAMGLRYPYYQHIDFKKTAKERKELKRLKSMFKIVQANS